MDSKNKVADKDDKAIKSNKTKIMIFQSQGEKNEESK